MEDPFAPSLLATICLRRLVEHVKHPLTSDVQKIDSLREMESCIEDLELGDLKTFLGRSGPDKFGAFLRRMQSDQGSRADVRMEASRLERLCREKLGMIATDVVPEQSGGLQLGALPEVPGPLTTVQTVCDEVHNVMDLPISDEVGMDLPSDGPSRISSTEPLTTPNDDVMDLDFEPKATTLHKLVGFSRGPTARGREIHPQARKVIATAVEAVWQGMDSRQGEKKGIDKQVLKGVPTSVLLKELISRLPKQPGEVEPKCNVKRTLASRFVGSVLQIPASTAQHCWRQVAAGDVQERHDDAVTSEVTGAETVDFQRESLMMIVRPILANAVSNVPHTHFPLTMMRFMLAVKSLLAINDQSELMNTLKWPTKFMNEWIAPVVEYLGARAAATLLGEVALSPLEGLQIPSDVELFFDAYTPGELFHSTRATLMLTGVVVSSPNFSQGSSAIFACAPGSGADDRASPKAKSILEALQAGPLGITAEYLKKTLAVLCTDGAYTRGELGADKRHNPVNVPGEFDVALGRRCRRSWDEFHRINKAAKKAMTQSTIATRWLHLMRDLEAAFGGGQGKSLDLQLCEYLNEKHHAGMVPSGTREFGYMLGVPGRFFKKWKHYYNLIQLRRSHAQDDRTGHNVKYWTALGNTLASCELILFISCFNDTLLATSEYVHTAQMVRALPSQKSKAFANMISKLDCIVAEIEVALVQRRRMQVIDGYTMPADLSFFCLCGPRPS